MPAPVVIVTGVSRGIGESLFFPAYGGIMEGQPQMVNRRFALSH
jgi:hypothetical protein